MRRAEQATCSAISLCPAHGQLCWTKKQQVLSLNPALCLSCVPRSRSWLVRLFRMKWCVKRTRPHANNHPLWVGSNPFCWGIWPISERFEWNSQSTREVRQRSSAGEVQLHESTIHPIEAVCLLLLVWNWGHLWFHGLAPPCRRS